MTERVETSMRWVGDWPWWVGVPAALVLGLTAWLLYVRDVGPMNWWMRVALPTLRSLAVVMIVLMLSGPVLHHRKTIGELAKLWVFVDGSASMTLTDPSMELGRKVLILNQLDLLSPGTVKLELPQASEALANAQAVAERVLTIPGIDEAQWKAALDEFEKHVNTARDLITAAANEGDRLDRFKREVLDPVKELGNRKLEKIDDRNKAVQDLVKLGEKTKRWQAELQEVFAKSVAALATADSPLKSAVAKFDALPRWQRVQASLLETGEKKLLGQLAQNYDVQLLTIDGHAAKSLWQPTAKSSDLPAALPKPVAAITDLGGGLKGGVGGTDKELRGAVVLLSDGQHNEGDPPVEFAKLLAGRQTPVYTVGVGSEARPRDLAVIKVTTPDSVFFEDRVRGEIWIKDDAATGQPFIVTIKDGDKIVSETKLLSESKPVRRVPFDFAVKELAEPRMKAAQAANAGTEVSGFPIELQVAVSPVDGERELGNNAGTLRFRAVTQKRKILIVDGRPRWESRYLRNMFDRDEQWETTMAIAGTKVGENGLSRGEKSDQFPPDREHLDVFDLIVFGEVPKNLWKGDELTWLREFVEKRGGAIAFIDGSRGVFKEYKDTPLAALFPVDLPGAVPVREGIQRLTLTERGGTLASFALAPEKELNADTWMKLPAPHWLSGAKPLPGAEVLLEAEVNGQKVPAAVVRPFGAGKVFYHAFDDSWRWRYEVADQWHVKYWNQAANWIAELPFAVRDKFVSLDAGAITYQPGDNADLRVRLRDGDGKPVSNATVDAVLYREGKKAATIRLTAEEGGSGLFRGKTAALEPGAYEVAVESAAIPESQLKARTQFKVEPRETGELTQLSLNEDLLRQVAVASGGRYLREENIDQLTSLLAPMSQGKVIESDTVLWQSWWWFTPLITLLTIEWLLRKRAGML